MTKRNATDQQHVMAIVDLRNGISGPAFSRPVFYKHVGHAFSAPALSNFTISGSASSILDLLVVQLVLLLLHFPTSLVPHFPVMQFLVMHFQRPLIITHPGDFPQ